MADLTHLKTHDKITNFRTWLQEIWMQHKDELQTYGQKCDYEMSDYFRKYKYWLKREYQHQTRNR